MKEIKDFLSLKGDEAKIARDIRRKLETLEKLEQLANTCSYINQTEKEKIACYLSVGLGWHDVFYTLYGWVFLHSTGNILDDVTSIDQSRSWIDEWLFGKKTQGVLHSLGVAHASDSIDIIKILTICKRWFDSDGEKEEQAHDLLVSLFNEQDFSHFVGVNRYQNVLWFNKERFEQILWWLFIVSSIEDLKEGKSELMQNRYKVIEHCLAAEKLSNFQVEKLMEATIIAKSKKILDGEKPSKKK